MQMFFKAIALTEEILTRTVALLSRHGFDTKRYRFNIPEVWYSPWNEDVKFNVIYSEISKNTIISKRKLFDLYQIGSQVNHGTNGVILEVGTLRGGCGGLLASVFPEKKIVLWDNWGKSVEEDCTFIKKSYSNTNDLQQAKQLLKKINTTAAVNASFINDIFPNPDVISTLGHDISFVHFDIYDSNTFTSGIELLWPHLPVGGVFVIGGYGAISLNSLTDSVNQFVAKNNCLFVQSQSGIGLIFKQ